MRTFRPRVALLLAVAGLISLAAHGQVPPKETVSAGYDNNVISLPNGRVWSWGGNTAGKLGNGTTASSSIPVEATGLVDVIAVATGMGHTLAIKAGATEADNKVWAWGLNQNRQLGYLTPQCPDPLDPLQTVPCTCGIPGQSDEECSVAPQEVPGLTGVVAIGAGWGHSIALKSDGTVWTWGSNEHGALGRDGCAGSCVPGQVPGVADGAEIGAGYFHNIVLRNDGTIVAWGKNDEGQLGTGDKNPVDAANPGPYAANPFLADVELFLAGSGVVAVASRGGHNLALKSNGEVWAWGWNLYGQVGYRQTSNPPNDQVFAKRILSSGVVEIAAGHSFGLARKGDGKFYAWGSNHAGQLGIPIADVLDLCGQDTNIPCARSPLLIPAHANATRIAAGGAHSLTVRPDGTIILFGSNASGQLGFDADTNTFSTGSYDPDFVLTPAGVFGSGGSVGKPSSTGALNVQSLDGGVAFSSQPKNVTSSVSPLTMTNLTADIATITSISANGDFSASDNCGGSLPGGQTCDISVVFTPAAAGVRTGTLTINSDLPNAASIRLSLTGIGVDIPGPPTLGTPVAGDGQATFPFTPPASDGGSAITGYTVICSPSGSQSGAASPITVSGLANGTLYTCTATATNAVGSSIPSNEVSVTPVSAATVPDAPGIGTATRGNAKATITFTPPASNGGSAIIDYTATCNPGAVTKTGTVSPLVVTGLTNGTLYSCSVKARNAVGSSVASGTVNVTPATVPGAPTGVTGTPGNAQATIGFTAPASNGGDAIIDYTATCGAITKTGAASPLVVTGLTNGTAYTCTVKARNSVGSSVASASVSVTLSASAGMAKRYDFNGDARSDVLWRDPAGVPTFWHLNGASITSGNIQVVSTGTLTVSASFSVVGVGDFNGDGKADILLRNPNSGSNVIWHLDGATITSGKVRKVSVGNLPNLASGWTVIGTGDFNGDGKSDILWRDPTGVPTLWNINGASIVGGNITIVSQGTLSLSTGFNVHAIGDFNGDGKADVLWRKESSGSNRIWHLDGAIITAGKIRVLNNSGLQSLNSTWSISGVGDFNGDGKSDLLWRDPAGQGQVWNLNGAAIVASQVTVISTGTVSTAAGFIVAGVGDYNGDGKTDVLFRNPTSGSNRIWHLDSNTITAGKVRTLSAGNIPSLPNTWTAVNTR